MDEMIRQEIHKEADRCPVQSIPWENICDRALDNTVANTTFHRNAVIRKICCSFAAVIAIGCLLVMSGFISPVIARALEQIPVINAVFNFVGDRGIQNAIDQGFVAKPNLTATDKDISVTITGVLYDQGRIDIGYTVTTSRPDLYLKDIWPYSIPLLIADRQLFVNGKALRATSQGTAERIENGNVGLMEIYPRGDLPETFDLQIVIRQIDDQFGKWSLTVPVSRQYTDAATKVILPIKTVTVGQTTITVKKIQIAPSSTTVDWELKQPITAPHFSSVPFLVEDDKGEQCVFRPISGSPLDHQVEGDVETWTNREVYESPESIPEYLVLRPNPTMFHEHSQIDSQLQEIKIFLD